MLCKDINCPIATGIGKVEKLSTGEVLASKTNFFRRWLDYNLRRSVLNGKSVFDGFHLKPVDQLEDKPVPQNSKAVCNLPEILTERASEGGAGTAEIINCPYQTESFEIFSARVK